MPRSLKIALGVLGAVVALVAVAAAIFAATFDPNAWKPQLVEQVERQYQRTLQIPGRIELSFFPRLGAKVGEAHLSEHRSKAPFASVQSARVSVALWPLLRRQVVVDRIEIDGLRATLKRGRDGRMNIDDLVSPSKPAAGGASAPAGTAGTTIDIAGVDLRNAALAFDDQREGRRVEAAIASLRTGRIAPGARGEMALDVQVKSSKPALDARVRLDGGYLVDAAAGRYAFDKLQARIDGTLDRAPLALALSVPQLEIADQVKAQKIDATLKQTQGARSLDVKLSLPAFTGTRQALRTTLSLSVDGRQGDRTLRASGDGHLTVNLDKKNAALDLKGRVDDSAYAARVWLAQFAPLSMRFDVSVDAFDADRWRSTAPADPKAPAKETPLDLSALRELDLRGTLKVGALKVAGVQASELRAEMKAAGGRVDVQPIAAKLYGGTAEGSLTVMAGPTPRFALRQTLTDVRLGPLLKDAAGSDRVDGRGRVVLDVATQGTLPSALKRNLGGSARVALRDGTFRGIDLGRIVQIAGGSGTASGREQTPFSQLDASFRITGGVARNDDLVAVSPLMRVTGAGDVDLAEERLDYRLKADITAGIPRLQGRSVPVRLRGPFTSISYSVDVESLAKEALKDKIEKGLGDKLKGLFGR